MNNENKDKENIIVIKTYDFAKCIIELYKQISKDFKEYTLSKQILRCGTSIGANVEESVGAVSTKDFENKLGIAYKEARETKYWLRLLSDTGYINKDNFEKLYNDCDEISKLIFTIIRSSRSNR